MTIRTLRGRPQASPLARTRYRGEAQSRHDQRKARSVRPDKRITLTIMRNAPGDTMRMQPMESTLNPEKRVLTEVVKRAHGADYAKRGAGGFQRMDRAQRQCVAR
jgi:hypothetical protein